MSRLYGLHPVLATAVEAETSLDDFVVWARSGDGRWAQLLDMEEHISVEVYLESSMDLTEHKAKAKPSANVLGFSGCIQGMELSIPNDHLYTELMQILTILELLPREENINDHTYKFHMRKLKEARERRNKEEDMLAQILYEESSNYENLSVYIRELCAEHGISLHDKTDEELELNFMLNLRKVARKMRREKENG